MEERGLILGVVVAQGDAPEDHVEEEEDHEVDNSTQVVYLVSLHPVRVPAGVLSEGINLVLVSSRRRQLIVLTSSSALGETQPRVDGFGLSTIKHLANTFVSSALTIGNLSSCGSLFT